MNEILAGIPVFLPPSVPAYTPSPGSIQVAAECCGEIVWQGVSQQLVKAQRPEMKIMCPRCAFAMLAADGLTQEEMQNCVRSLT